jgi:hypothetical protein
LREAVLRHPMHCPFPCKAAFSVRRFEAHATGRAAAARRRRRRTAPSVTDQSSRPPRPHCSSRREAAARDQPARTDQPLHPCWHGHLEAGAASLAMRGTGDWHRHAKAQVPWTPELRCRRDALGGRRGAGFRTPRPPQCGLEHGYEAVEIAVLDVNWGPMGDPSTGPPPTIDVLDGDIGHAEL